MARWERSFARTMPGRTCLALPSFPAFSFCACVSPFSPARRTEGGCRDAKRLLGFAQARIAELQAWTRRFALVAAALLVLTHLGTPLLRHPQRQAWLRQARSRRRARSELSVVAVVCHLLDHVTALWKLLDPHAKLN